MNANIHIKEPIMLTHQEIVSKVVYLNNMKLSLASLDNRVKEARERLEKLEAEAVEMDTLFEKEENELLESFPSREEAINSMMLVQTALTFGKLG